MIEREAGVGVKGVSSDLHPEQPPRPPWCWAPGRSSRWHRGGILTGHTDREREAEKAPCQRGSQRGWLLLKLGTFPQTKIVLKGRKNQKPCEDWPAGSLQGPDLGPEAGPLRALPTLP